MASKFQREKKDDLRPRKGHDLTWSCDKHGLPISFYCKKHKTPICDRCAIKEHCQKPCELEDIENVIFEMKGMIDDTMQQIEDGQNHLKRLHSQLMYCGTLTSNHIKLVNDMISASFEGKMKKVKDREKDDIRVINEEADEDIRIINEKRGKRIKECKTLAEQEQQDIMEKLANIMSETKAIDTMVAKRVEKFKLHNKHKLDTMDNMVSKINRTKQSDQMLVMEARQIIASLDESYNANDLEAVTDSLDMIKREVRKVRFIEGEVDGKHCARIDGYMGRWELVKSLDFPTIVEFPISCVRVFSDDEIYLWDWQNNLYLTSISTSHSEKVNYEAPNMCIVSCAAVDSNLTVCSYRIGQCTEKSLDGCIVLYDKQWKLVRQITIPRNTSHADSDVFVDVDKDGMILAAEYDQSNIYVINPADGKIESTITMQGKLVRGAFQALSSGDIVAKTDRNTITIVSRSGEEKAAIPHEDVDMSICFVDKLTDTLYITNWDRERHLYVVDQASSDGGIHHTEGIIQYAQSDRTDIFDFPSSPAPSGHLVACDGDKILVFKKSFSLHN